jgi:hypothetical protein
MVDFGLPRFSRMLPAGLHLSERDEQEAFNGIFPLSKKVRGFGE